MEYRNYYNTPRDSVSDEMLTELLREKEPDSRAGDVRPMRQYENGRGVRMENRPNSPQVPNCRGEYPVVPAANVEHHWENPRLDGSPLAMVYSPVQEWEGIYEVAEALKQGTLFKKLDLDFYPGCCGK